MIEVHKEAGLTQGTSGQTAPAFVDLVPGTTVRHAPNCRYPSRETARPIGGDTIEQAEKTGPGWLTSRASRVRSPRSGFRPEEDVAEILLITEGLAGWA